MPEELPPSGKCLKPKVAESCALLWLKTGLACRVSKTKALSERCEQQCFAKGFVELRTVVRSFSW